MPQIKSLLLCAVALGWALPLSSAAAQSPEPVTVQTPAGDPEARRTYILGPDDEVIIHALYTPEISDKPQRIDADGDLKLPMIGRLRAAGLTVRQLEAEVVERLKSFVKSPDVSITVAEYHGYVVTVLGAVNSPGAQALDSGKTLIEVLSTAGGASADAGPIIRITRRLDEGPIPLPDATTNLETGFSIAEVPMKPLLDASIPEQNILLRPNDVLSVPRAEVVYVVGEVAKIGQVPLSRGETISVVEAISASGGVLRTAAGSRARILRVAPDAQNRTEIPVDVNKIMEGVTIDVALVAGDILVVPDSGGKRATARALEAAVQFGIMAGSYAVLR